MRCAIRQMPRSARQFVEKSLDCHSERSEESLPYWDAEKSQGLLTAHLKLV